MARAYHLKLRCFLEGIEVPIISANLNIQYDSPAQCQVQIPATDKALEFLPRTLIHIFFNYGEFAEPSSNVRVNLERSTPEQTAELAELDLKPLPDFENEGTDIGLRDQPDFEAAQAAVRDDEGDEFQDDVRRQAGEEERMSFESDELDRKWKLFYSGEVTGYQFVKSSGQRALILQCLDLSNYWDTCYQYQVNVSSLHGNATAHFVGAGTTVFDTFFRSSTGSIVDIVRRRSFSRPELTGLQSGIVHLLERVGGVYGSRGFRGINDFFTLAELRLHLVDMISAASSDESSQRLFPRRAFNAWTRREGGRLSKIASFRDMLNLINKFIFHNVVPNPIAMYVHPREFERTTRQTTRGETTVSFNQTPQGRDIERRINSAISSLHNYRNTNRPPRNGGLSGDINRLAGNIQQIKSAMEPYISRFGLQQAGLSIGRARAAVFQLGQTVSGYESHGLVASTRTDSDFSYSHMFSRRRTNQKYEEAMNHLGAAIGHIGGSSSTRQFTNTREVSETVRRGGRLNNQIIRPDIFMCSPPRCNVFFPDFYTQFNATRQFLREVTRLRLTVSDMIFGPDSLLNSVYFAPDVEVMGARIRQGTRRGSYDNATLRHGAYARRLMRHELLTGPIPIFERMNEVNVIATRSQNVQHRGARVPYVTRAANFQFFKHRFSPRTAQVSGPFNPFVVCGLPAVVMDNWMTEQQVAISNQRGLELLHTAQMRQWGGLVEDYETASHLDDGAVDAWLALRETVPTQHVGLISTLQHQIAQNMATTSATLVAARTHREREELLGANEVRVSRADAQVENADTTVAALASDPPRVGQLGPNYGLITEVTSLDSDSGRYQLFGTFRDAGPRRYETIVDVGLTQAAEAYGPEVVTLLGGAAETEVTFSAFRVHEEIDRQSDREVEVPLEDFIRPPWMSDVWANDRIGGIYQELLGTGSITDPVEVETGYQDQRESGEEDQTARAREGSIQDPVRQDGRTQQSAGMEITIERAIDLLVRTYSAIKHAGNDTGGFTQAYIYRPIATMIDILGSRDLTINPSTGERTGGIEGIHSRAFGHGEMGRNPRNLIPEGSDTERILGFDTEDRQEDLQRMDMRAPKAEKVAAYVEEIRRSRALLG